MKDKIRKLEAYAEHMLMQFLELERNYSVLEPMLFDESISRRYECRHAMRGFMVVRNSLLSTCIQGVANLYIDRDKRVSSLVKFRDSFVDENLMGMRKVSYMEWCMSGISGDPNVVSFHRSYYSNQFDDCCGRFKAAMLVLDGLCINDRVSKVRDKWVSHREIVCVDGEYDFFDPSSSMLTFEELGVAIRAIRDAVEGVNQVFRGSSFDWAGSSRNNDLLAKSFWGVD